MARTQHEVPHWECPTCSYTIDCELTQEKADALFNRSQGYRKAGLRAGNCPSCHLRGVVSALAESSGKVFVEVMGKEELAAVRVESGATEEYQDEETGLTMTRPVLRALTAAEKRAREAEIDAANEKHGRTNDADR